MSGNDDAVTLLPTHIEHVGVPRTMADVTQHAVDSMQMAADLVAMFERDRAFKPDANILIWAYDNATPVVLMQDDGMEVAEMADMIMEIIDHQREQHEAHGRGLDYDTLRERNGYVSRDRASNVMMDKIQERVARHLANPVTDPFREPRRDQLGHLFRGITLPGRGA